MLSCCKSNIWNIDPHQYVILNYFTDGLWLFKEGLKKATEYDTLKMSETGGITGQCEYGSITNREVGCGQGEGKRSRKEERKSKKKWKWKIKRAMPTDFPVWMSALNVSKVLVSYVLCCFCFNNCSVLKKS